MSHEDESVTPVTTHCPRGSSFRAAPTPENCSLFWPRPSGSKI